MSLRVATVFSGIGAIEHALERMGIEHDIVFACDNSNIDPFDAPKVSKDATKKSLLTRSARSRTALLHTLAELEELMNLKNNELHRCFEADCDYCKPSIMEISHIIPLNMFIGPQMRRQ